MLEHPTGFFSWQRSHARKFTIPGPRHTLVLYWVGGDRYGLWGWLCIIGGHRSPSPFWIRNTKRTHVHSLRLNLTQRRHTRTHTRRHLKYLENSPTAVSDTVYGFNQQKGSCSLAHRLVVSQSWQTDSLAPHHVPFTSWCHANVTSSIARHVKT